jgi:SAM-dependent methyltransferase
MLNRTPGEEDPARPCFRERAMSFTKHLNVGCGFRPYDGFINLDILEWDGVDVVHDLTDLPLPFPDDFFGYIFAAHVLEHIPHRVPGIEGEALIAVVNELIRIAEPDALLEVHAPVGVEAHAVVDHARIIDDITFRTWDPGWVNYSIAAEAGQRFESPGLLRPLESTYNRDFRLGPLTGWHTRKYLGLEVGLVSQKVLLYEVVK